MLVLTRTLGERIHIGNDTVVLVRTVNSGQVSIGVEAPKSVTVLREELLTSASTVDAKQQLETQRADGGVHREDFKQAEVIARTQEILNEVAPSLGTAATSSSPVSGSSVPSPSAIPVN